jgi:putative two-component system response regulator
MSKMELLIVDDEPINLAVLSKLLNPYYKVRACKSGQEALELVDKITRPDLVLLDIMMPGLDGYETLSRMQEIDFFRETPVIYISALDGAVDEEKGFHLGAVDYITKPFRPAIVLERVRVHLELKQARDRLKNQNNWLEAEVERRVRENMMIQDATLSVITQLVETRDNDTANHILRTRAYVELLGRRLQNHPRYTSLLSDEMLSLIVKAAPLHDIGKIGVSDAILMKPGKLNAEEYEIMKTHCHIGGGAIRSAMEKIDLIIDDNGNKGFLSLGYFNEAINIATYHHERWDGKGYPEGLKGEEIPLSARLMALADVFDALTTPRVYKKPWTMDEAVALIIQEKGHQFDPQVVEAFEAELPAFENIMRSIADGL